MYKLSLVPGLSLVADTVNAPDTVDGNGATVHGAITSFIHIMRDDNTVALVLETNWSQAVFANNFPAWLIALVAKINAFLTKYLAEQQGPATQADLEAALTAKLTFDTTANQVVINH